MINLEKEIHEGGLLSKHSDSSGKKKKNSILKNEFNKILNRKEEWLKAAKDKFIGHTDYWEIWKRILIESQFGYLVYKSLQNILKNICTCTIKDERDTSQTFFLILLKMCQTYHC